PGRGGGGAAWLRPGRGSPPVGSAGPAATASAAPAPARPPSGGSGGRGRCTPQGTVAGRPGWAAGTPPAAGADTATPEPGTAPDPYSRAPTAAGTAHAGTTGPRTPPDPHSRGPG